MSAHWNMCSMSTARHSDYNTQWKKREHQLFRASSIHIQDTGAQCWWQQPLLLPGFLSAGCGQKQTQSLSVSPFNLHTTGKHQSTHRSSGARDSLSWFGLRSWMYFQDLCLFPAPSPSRWRCSAYKQLTASTILWSHDPGCYQIRAITCCSSSFLRQLNGAVGGCVHVSLFPACVCMCGCLYVVSISEECELTIKAWRQVWEPGRAATTHLALWR